MLLNHDQTGQARSAHLLEGPNKEKALHYQKEPRNEACSAPVLQENPTCYLFQEFAGSTKAKSRQKVKAPTDPRIGWKKIIRLVENGDFGYRYSLNIALINPDFRWFSLVQSIWAFVKCHLNGLGQSSVPADRKSSWRVDGSGGMSIEMLRSQVVMYISRESNPILTQGVLRKKSSLKRILIRFLF